MAKQGRYTAKKSNCPISKKCGGCQYIDKSYAEQLKIKTDQVKKLLAPYGSVDEIIGMKEPYHYRNKVNAAFQHKRNGEILAGVYEEGTHRVLSVDDCKIENRLAQEIVETIRGLLRSFKITVYNEDSGYGLLRHVMIRDRTCDRRSYGCACDGVADLPIEEEFCEGTCQSASADHDDRAEYQ